MPGFTYQSAVRISNVVRKVEAEGIDLRTLPAQDRGQPGWQWFLLTGDFDSDRLAPAKFGRWSVSENDGDGDYDRITGLTTAAVTGGNFNIDNVSVIRGADPREDTSSTSETVAVVNTMGWDADDNAHVFAEWNQTSESWVAYQVECPA